MDIEYLNNILLSHLFILFGGVVFLSILVPCVVHLYRKRKRRVALAQMAHDLRWKFMNEDGKDLHGQVIGTKDDISLIKRFNLKCLSGGYHINVLVGERDGANCLVADYLYYVKQQRVGGKTKRHRRTVFAISISELDLPNCQVSPSGRLLEAIHRVSNTKDVNFDDDPEFSRQFFVECADETAVRRMLSPSLRIKLVELAPKHIRFETRGNMFAFHYGRMLSPEEVYKQIDQAWEFLSILGRNT